MAFPARRRGKTWEPGLLTLLSLLSAETESNGGRFPVLRRCARWLLAWLTLSASGRHRRKFRNRREKRGIRVNSPGPLTGVNPLLAFRTDQPAPRMEHELLTRVLIQSGLQASRSAGGVSDGR
jgi:hypothetical protein